MSQLRTGLVHKGWLVLVHNTHKWTSIIACHCTRISATLADLLLPTCSLKVNDQHVSEDLRLHRQRTCCTVHPLHSDAALTNLHTHVHYTHTYTHVHSDTTHTRTHYTRTVNAHTSTYMSITSMQYTHKNST